MSKRMMLLALAVVSAAMFALPAMASANFLHIDKTSTFTVKGGPAALSTTTGETVKCQEVSGNGAFTTTTTGTLSLKFGSTCETQTIFGAVHCQTAGVGTGLIETTQLEFHLVTIDPGGTEALKGILITPNGVTKVFAHFECAGINKTVEGNGVVGTITAPNCGVASTTATMAFQATAHGVQKHTTVTGVKYGLTSGGNAAAQEATATVTFPEKRTLTCT